MDKKLRFNPFEGANGRLSIYTDDSFRVADASGTISILVSGYKQKGGDPASALLKTMIKDMFSASVNTQKELFIVGKNGVLFEIKLERKQSFFILCVNETGIRGGEKYCEVIFLNKQFKYMHGRLNKP